MFINQGEIVYMKIIPLCLFNTTNLKSNIVSCNKTNTTPLSKQNPYVDYTVFKGNTVMPYKVGSSIKSIGLIIGEPKVLNNLTNKLEDCYLIYQNSKRDGVIRLIKKDLPKISDLSNQLQFSPQVMEILENHNFYTADAILNKVKPVNSNVVDLFNDLRISEVGYTTITKDRGKQIIIDKGYKCPPDSDIIFVEDLILKQKEYSKATRLVYLPLLTAFKNNGDKNILTVALAIGENSASPVHLYQRMGFKPLKDSINEIESHTKSIESLHPFCTCLGIIQSFF